MIKLDDWQREVLNTEGHICLRSGRQVGKSTVVALKAGEYAANNRKKTILVIASVERQAYLLFEKIIAYLEDKYRHLIVQGKERPTKSRVKLKNGSTIYCLPTGLTGHGIRGYTVDLLIADEAAFIPEEVWAAVTPMLVTRKGTIILLSTPFGKDRYFYKCFNDPNFTKFHISSEDCPRMDKDFLAREKETMTRLQYAQEYLGEFVDDLIQFFPTDLIKQNTTLSPDSTKRREYKYFLGVDIARFGEDQSTYVIVEQTEKYANVKEIFIDEQMRSTHVIGRIKDLNRKWDFDKILIDDAGIGGAIFDVLLEDEETRRKIEGVNNSSKSITREENPRRRKILKEDLYTNTLRLLEHKKLNLIKEPELFRSLISVQYEYTKEGNVKIKGKYDHIAEGLVRACWAVKDKDLNIWVSYI